MPKGLDQLFSNSGSSTTTLLPPSPRRAVDAGNSDTPRGQSFRKALDQAKPKPKTDDSQPVQQKPASRTKASSKKTSSNDKADAPADQNAAAPTDQSDDQPKPADDIADHSTDPTDDAQPVDEKPAKADAADEALPADDAATQADAATLAAQVVTDTTATAQPQQQAEAAPAEEATATQAVAKNNVVEYTTTQPRRAAPRATKNTVAKAVASPVLKKPAAKEDAQKSTDTDGAADDVTQEIPQQSEEADDQAPVADVPEEATVAKTAPAQHHAKPTAMQEEDTDRPVKPTLRQPTKAKTDVADEQTAPVADLSQIDPDAGASATSDDHDAVADRLAPLQALGILDPTASAPKSAANGPVQSTPQPAPPPAPEADFASNNHDRIVTSMRSQLLPNGGAMHLRLDPPELGVLQVTVRMVDGAMTASFETSNDQATKLLSHSLGQLKNVLETQGVNVERLHVQQTSSNQQSSSNSEDRQQSTDQDNQSARQEQQRREMLQRMWRRLRLGSDPLDTLA